MQLPVLPLVLALAGAIAAQCAAQSDPRTDPRSDPRAGAPVRFEGQSVRVDAAPRLVTVYEGRAAVTRSVRRLLGPGTYDFTFAGLPSGAQRESLRAYVSGPGRVMGVEYVERAAGEAASPRLAELDAALARNEEELARRREDRALIDARWADLDAVSARAAQSAGADGGAGAIDLDVVDDQLVFFAAGRHRLLEERREVDKLIRALEEERRILETERASLGASSRAAREAIVSVAVDGGTEIAVDLVYIVTDAGWRPTYNIRAAADGSRVDIEYDALIEQRSGEDWTDVELVLSTAQPARDASPPELSPWFIDVRDDADLPKAAASPAPEPDLERLGAAVPPTDAEVRGSGPSVTYVLPRPATIRSDARRRQRARIGNVTCRPIFTHVAIPLVTESVYVRSDLVNESDFQLLPGAVAIFVGADYVGPTTLRDIAPHEAFEVYFGIDRAVTAKRTILVQEEAKTGLLGGGRKSSYDYRIELANGAGKAIAVELWDRMPVSRSDRVEVQLANLSHDLSGDAAYLEGPFTRGLLKWDLSVPASAQNALAMVVEFGVRVVRAKDVEVRGLPE